MIWGGRGDTAPPPLALAYIYMIMIYTFILAHLDPKECVIIKVPDNYCDVIPNKAISRYIHNIIHT